MVGLLEVQVFREEAFLALREEELEMTPREANEVDRGEVRPEAKGEFPGAFLAVRLDGLEEAQEVRVEDPMGFLEVSVEQQALQGRMSGCWPCLRLSGMFNDSRSSISGTAETAIVRRGSRSHGTSRRLRLRARQGSMTSLMISKRHLQRRTHRVPRTGQSLWMMRLLERRRLGEITSS